MGSSGAYAFTSALARRLRVSFVVGWNVSGPKSCIHVCVLAT